MAQKKARERVAVVHNPSKGDGTALREALASACRRAGLAVPYWFETAPHDGGSEAADDAARSRATLVVASGGDGTVHTVADRLRGTTIPMAIAPQGTGNLLARNLGIPMADVDAWVDAALHGTDRAIDMGLATLTDEHGATSEHTFTVMAGLGLDAAMIANARPGLKKRLGWLAYADSALRSAPKNLQIPIRFTLDDDAKYTARVSMMLFGNCGLLQGGIPIIPDASPDDGLLDLAVVQPRTLFDWLFVWRRIAWENRVLNRSAFGRRLVRLTGAVRSQNLLRYFRGEHVRVEVDTPQPFEVDGEDCGDVLSAECSLDPGALVVRVPRDAAVDAGAQRTLTAAVDEAAATSDARSAEQQGAADATTE